MVSIKTNLSSLIAQRSLGKSTNRLDLAIERMTTGYKVNHAGDNAANYSISTNMSTQMSAYEIAQDNVSMGLDLVMTVQDTISLMQSHGKRIHALITQAQNGTYGAASLEAINAEVFARISEINRIYSSAEYNGIDVLQGIKLPDWAETVKANAGTAEGETVGLTSDLMPKYNGFIEDPTARDGSGNPINVDSLTSVAGLANFTSADSFKIESKSDLEHFRDLVNSGASTVNKTFYLNADIDLGAVAEDVTNWTPIGYYTDSSDHMEFKGVFDGNGHKITNLSINNESADYQALFGGQMVRGVVIKNLGVEGRVKGKEYTGGLASYVISDGSKVSVIENCYSDVIVTGTGDYAGGLVGRSGVRSQITNCYATGTVTGTGNYAGGLVGRAMESSQITNSYATGVVTGTGNYAGGLVGATRGSVANCYATGNVSGKNYTGGLAGVTRGSVANCYATGNVSGTSGIGGLVGALNNPSDSINWENILSTGTVTSSTVNQTGSLIGGIFDTTDGSSFSTINISNASALSQELSMIGFEGNSDGTSYSSGQMEGWLENIKALIKPSIALQLI